MNKVGRVLGGGQLGGSRFQGGALEAENISNDSKTMVGIKIIEHNRLC